MGEAKEEEKEKKSSICKSIMKMLFSHVGLFFIVAVYAIVGAYALISIEQEAENYRFQLKKLAAQDMEDSVDYITNFAWFHSQQAHKKEEFMKLMRTNLDLYHRFIVDKATTVSYDGDATQWNYDWTFSKSLLFTFTTMGAIGYGHISPKTSVGQIFTMYYAMIGVPLLLLFLANIGDFFASSFKYIYSRLCCRLCRIRRKATTLIPGDSLKPKILWEEDIGNETFMPTKQVDVPIVVNLCLIFIYLMVGGAIFGSWENWTMSEAAYFTFITLTTIGFGDYVPGNSFAASGDQAIISMLKMLTTIIFCLFGMALVSMAINLMQEQLVGKVKWVGSQMGGKSKYNKNSMKYQIKKSPEGSVACTPPDRDGNYQVSLFIKNADDNSKKKKKVQFS